MGEEPRPRSGVLTFGEALVGYASGQASLAAATAFTRFLGGADLNVAVGLGRLGVRATYATVLGEDAHGDFAAARLDELEVPALLRRAPGPTAVMFKAGAGTGDPEVLQFRHDTAFARGAGAVVPEVSDLLRRVAHVHLTGITLGVSAATREATLLLLDAARSAGCTVSFDPNLRLPLWPDRDEMRKVVNGVAARADVVLPGAAEARLLTGTDDPEEVMAFYCGRGAGEVAVKLGAEGAAGGSLGAEVVRSRRFPVRPVDSVGAGDGFAAGYLAGMLAGEGFQDRLDRAAAVGALVTTRAGDLDAMPSRAEVDALLRSR
ncbi:2-dehydro-3-deoxygluconokinase [Microlunatus sagamiharensis]|uniref:2-dehydro-3-deoxygluconokinase n=1 Tax=Microlunatus sagamiharensis TaxID=546874 RepID=A0A1H2MUD7_9ACTN|nr:sugar kinase [Microlunatus sagamiharensis]SDU96724.1 2-dehydro-3-deoxygluconokinase [Microlunatus sagamiharensis]